MYVFGHERSPVWCPKPVTKHLLMLKPANSHANSQQSAKKWGRDAQPEEKQQKEMRKLIIQWQLCIMCAPCYWFGPRSLLVLVWIRCRETCRALQEENRSCRKPSLQQLTRHRKERRTGTTTKANVVHQQLCSALHDPHEAVPVLESSGPIVDMVQCHFCSIIESALQDDVHSPASTRDALSLTLCFANMVGLNFPTSDFHCALSPLLYLHLSPPLQDKKP